MAKKKTKTDSTPKDKPFRTAQFALLKTVVIADEKVAPVFAAPAEPVFKPVEDEDLLFRQAMAGARPLGAAGASVKSVSVTKNKVHGTGTDLLSSAEQSIASDFMDEVSRLKLQVTFTEEQPDEDELKSLSGNRLRQIKRGIVSVGAQLDLHGLTKDEALFELPRFLRSAQMRNESAVLVITGKGNHSLAEPVLQQAVAGWLRDAGRIMATEFAPAPPEMGGNGAFVVFLKKIKVPR